MDLLYLKIKHLNLPEALYIGPWDPKRIFEYLRTSQIDICIRTNIAKTNIRRREYYVNLLDRNKPIKHYELACSEGGTVTIRKIKLGLIATLPNNPNPRSGMSTTLVSIPPKLTLGSRRSFTGVPHKSNNPTVSYLDKTLSLHYRKVRIPNHRIRRTPAWVHNMPTQLERTLVCIQVECT
jgi:hypothetical protein